MEVKLQRMSGLPVDPELLKMYDDEFRAGYDAAEKKNAKGTNEDGSINLKAIDMLSMQQDLAALEDELKKKYKIEAICELPETPEQWFEIMRKYQSAMLIAPSKANPNELVLVILDLPLGA